MPELLLSMIQVAASWILIFICLAGIGLVFNKIFSNTGELNLETLLTAFWSGLAVLLVLLDIWHLFFALNVVVLVIVSLISLSGYFFYRSSLLEILKPGRFTPKVSYFLGLFILICLVSSYRVLGKVIDYNMGLYQLQIVQWYSQFPVIPGLANLHGCLAYNQTYFLYSALVESCPLFLPAYRIGNAIFLLVTIAQIFYNLNKIDYFLKSKISSIFQLILLFFLSYELVAGTINSAAPELLGHCLAIFIAQYTLSSLTDESPKSNRLYSFALLCILSITVKFTIGLFALICLLIVVVKTPEFLNRKNLLIGLAMISITLIPWVAHGIILSGCLLYPFALTALPFDWTAPTASIQTCSNWIYGWSRLPYKHWTEIENQWHWIPEWFRFVVASYPCYTVVPWTISSLSLIALLVRWNQIEKRALYLAWAGAIGGIPLFMLAPDPRYTAGLVWIVTAILMATVMEPYLKKNHWPKIIAGWLVICFIFSFSYVLPLNLFPVPNVVGIPDTKTFQFRTRSGLVVNVPKSGDQVWDCTIPSSPYPNPFLRLRDEKQIRSGFRSDARGNGVGVDP